MMLKCDSVIQSQLGTVYMRVYMMLYEGDTVDTGNVVCDTENGAP